MKRKFIIILSFVLSIGTMFAEKVQVGDLYYYLDAANQTARVTFQNASYPYWSTAITAAIIPEYIIYDYVTYYVTSIGDNAFSGCTSLTSVDIPNSVTSIGTLSFYQCTSLTSVNIPNSVSLIGNSTFNGCSGLTSVTIGNGVTYIGNNAFRDCTVLTSVLINSSEIVGNKYTSNSNLNRIFGSQVNKYIIGDSVSSIGDYAFYKCSKLTSVTIGSSVTDIGEYAFYNCTSMTSVLINSSTIVGNKYTNYLNLKKIFGSQVSEYIIGDDVTSIGDYAFYECSNLISITIPNSVTSIGKSAFAYCTGITEIEIPNNITSIGDYAFYECSGLMSITVPNSVTSIGKSAFAYCTGITEIEIPNNITSVGDYAFYECSSLTSPIYNEHIFAFLPTSYSGAYAIPSGIESIAGGAFYYCTYLTEITIPESITSIGSGAFAYCTGITEIEIPNNITSIGGYIFLECSNLTSVIWNATKCASPMSYNDAPFYSICSQITSFIFGEEVETIPAYLCYGMNKLTSITIPYSVINIGASAFYLVANIVYNGTANGFAWGARSVNGYIDGWLVYSDNSRTNLLACSSAATGTMEIFDSVKRIGQYAFYGCKGLKRIDISNSVSSIGDYAFYECYALTSITIPNSVTSIGKGAFSWCFGLTSIEVLCQTPPTLGSFVLNNSTNISAIYVPCGTLDIYRHSWADYADIIKYHSFEYAIEGKVNISGAGTVTIPTTICEGNIISAIPNYGYHFVQWSDGITDNPRSFVLTQDTMFTAEFDISRIGTCGDDNLLTWTYEPDAKQLIISGNGTLNTNYTFGIEAPSAMKTLEISNGITSVGSSAFKNEKWLTTIKLGADIETIGDHAFADCPYLLNIYAKMDYPPIIDASVFANDGDLSWVDLYVPEESLVLYKKTNVWKEFNLHVMETPTAVDNTTVGEKATKILRDGQILILRGEKVYTITGQEAR